MPAETNIALIWRSPGVVISLAIRAAGSEPIAFGMPPMRVRRRYDAPQRDTHAWCSAIAGPTVCIRPNTEPPGASRFPADEVDRVDQIRDQRAVPADAGTEPAVDGGARRADQVAGERADARRVDTGLLGGRLRGERLAQRLQATPSRRPGCAPRRRRRGRRRTSPAAATAARRHRRRERCRAIRMRGGLRAARIDDHHPPATLDDVVHAVLDARCGEETAV